MQDNASKDGQAIHATQEGDSMGGNVQAEISKDEQAIPLLRQSCEIRPPAETWRLAKKTELKTSLSDFVTYNSIVGTMRLAASPTSLRQGHHTRRQVYPVMEAR